MTRLKNNLSLTVERKIASKKARKALTLMYRKTFNNLDRI